MFSREEPGEEVEGQSGDIFLERVLFFLALCEGGEEGGGAQLGVYPCPCVPFSYDCGFSRGTKGCVLPEVRVRCVCTLGLISLVS